MKKSSLSDRHHRPSRPAARTQDTGTGQRSSPRSAEADAIKLLREGRSRNYHSRAARPAVISQVVDTVALVRTLVGDVYYRNDSMNCDHQVLAVCFMAFAVSLRGCFGVGCTHVKSTKEEKKSSRSAELLWARRLDHNLSRAHEA
jgi:hypothetical protein